MRDYAVGSLETPVTLLKAYKMILNFASAASSLLSFIICGCTKHILGSQSSKVTPEWRGSRPLRRCSSKSNCNHHDSSTASPPPPPGRLSHQPTWHDA
jgi:hypothetical protein